MTDDRHACGLELMQAVQGEAGAQAVLEAFDAVEPDFARFAVESGFADVYGRPVSTSRQRQLLNIAALTTLGGTEPQCHASTLRGALNAGVSPREIIEAVFHLSLTRATRARGHRVPRGARGVRGARDRAAALRCRSSTLRLG